MEPTEYPIKPTKPVVPLYSGDGLIQQTSPEYSDYTPPPPPPPYISFMPPPSSPHKYTIVVIALVGAAILVFGASFLFYLSVNSQRGTAHAVVTSTVPVVPTAAHNIVATPTSVPTVSTANPNYTASDIMNDFNTAGMRPGYVQYGQTIWSWSSDLYYVSIHATSSATFTDDSNCTGYCSPADLGIWVYSNSSEAHTSYYEVGNDEVSKGSIPMVGTPTEYVHGRCLLLGASLKSAYVQVATEKCV